MSRSSSTRRSCRRSRTISARIALWEACSPQGLGGGTNCWCHWRSLFSQTPTALAAALKTVLAIAGAAANAVPRPIACGLRLVAVYSPRFVGKEYPSSTTNRTAFRLNSSENRRLDGGIEACSEAPTVFDSDMASFADSHTGFSIES